MKFHQQLVHRHNMHPQLSKTEVTYYLCLLKGSKKHYIHCKTHCNFLSESTYLKVSNVRGIF